MYRVPIQERLREIDSKRIQGKFMVHNEVPQGQAELINMLEVRFNRTIHPPEPVH